jgi:UrcA family protein
MKTMQKISGLAGALVITTGMAAGFASNAEAAGKGIATRSVAVRYGDLDLRHEAGVRALYQRLRMAAKQACGTLDTRHLAAHAAWQDCRNAALADAVERLGNERVAALHRANDGDLKTTPRRIAVLE